MSDVGLHCILCSCHPHKIDADFILVLLRRHLLCRRQFQLVYLTAVSQKNVAANIWWLQTWLEVIEKRWLRPSLSRGELLYAGAAAADLGSYHRSLTATTSAGEAVGEADCDWAGSR